jgi:hypothetical protein
LRASNDALQYCSLQARSLSLKGWGLIDLPLRATFSPAHPLARRDVPLARASASCFLLCVIKPSLPRESPDCPSLRASDEHRFIVRVLRARRMVWRLPIPPFRGRALREQESTPAPLASNYTVKCCFTMSALNSLLLPDTTTAPLAITTYFSARRAAKWSPCSTNKMAKRLEFLNPIITSSI